MFIKALKHKIYLILYAPIYFYISWILSSFLLFKKNAGRTSKIWKYASLQFCKLLFVKEIRVHYKPEVLNKNKVLFISNHVNNLDWFMVWLATDALNMGKIYFNAKKTLLLSGNVLKKFSGNITNFIFLKRKLDYDYITLKKSCNDLKSMCKYVSVLFPEGTLYEDSKSHDVNLQRCKTRNKNLPRNVILPKTTGFEIIYEELGEDIDVIIDCTIIYSSEMSVKNFIKGIKSSVDIYLKVVNKCSDVSCEKFLFNLFEEKDLFIENVEKINKQFLNVEIKIPKRYKYISCLAIPWLCANV